MRVVWIDRSRRVDMFKKKDDSDMCFYGEVMPDFRYPKWPLTLEIQDGRRWRPSWIWEIGHNFAQEANFWVVFFSTHIYSSSSICWCTFYITQLWRLRNKVEYVSLPGDLHKKISYLHFSCWFFRKYILEYIYQNRMRADFSFWTGKVMKILPESQICMKKISPRSFQGP